MLVINQSESSKVRTPETRLARFLAQEAFAPTPWQVQGVPQGRPDQAGALDRFHGLQGWHDAHCARGRPFGFEASQEGDRRGGHGCGGATNGHRWCCRLHSDAQGSANLQDRVR